LDLKRWNAIDFFDFFNIKLVLQNLVSCLKGVDQVHDEGMLHSRQDVPLQFGVHVNFSICRFHVKDKKKNFTPLNVGEVINYL
jgi:hypothetical protein